MPAAVPHLSTATGPLVVFDRCALLQRIEAFIQPGDGVVLPDAYFYEAFTGRKEHEGARFRAWARRYADSIYLAACSDELEEREAAKGAPLDARSIIEGNVTKAFRERARGESLVWPERSLTANDVGGVADTQRRVDRFRNLCSEWRDYAAVKHPEMLGHPGTTADRHAAIGVPGGITDWVLKNYPHYRDALWLEHLSVFPDRLAACRWLRLLAWRVLKLSESNARDFDNDDFENSYLDCEYAFAASYVGALATSDERLKETVRAVFPYVAIREGPAPDSGS